MSTKLKIASAILLIPFILPTSVMALETRQETRQEARATRLENIKNKLDEIKLKVCQRHESNIVNRMTKLTELVTNMVGKFDATALRVEEYYKTKVLPTKPVSNYDALVADIQTKKTAVQTALASAQSNSTGFKCTNDDPKGHLTQFRLDMQNVKKALHEYRASIKNLIVAVKGVKNDKTK